MWFIDLPLIYSPWIVLYILGWLTSIDAIWHGRTAQGTIAWVLALGFLPMLALPLYLIFGDRKFFGYIRARRSGKDTLDIVAKQLHQSLTPFNTETQLSPPNQQTLETLSGLPFTKNNRVNILQDGNETYAAMLKALSEAKDYVLLQSYILRNDDIGQQFKQALIALRSRSVKVYVLYDEIGSNKLSRKYVQNLKAQGIEINSFNSNKGRLKLRVNFRNHRKLLIIDGCIGFAGGLNIGDEYQGKMPNDGNWRDTHCEVSGPIVQTMQLSFLEDWHWSTQQMLELNWQPTAASSNNLNNDISMLSLATGPADPLETCSLLFVQLINLATTRLWIAIPYFVPDQKLLSSIQLACLRGVDVRIILPGPCDAPWVQRSSFSFLAELISVGVKFFQYQPGILHQKVTLIDHRLCSLGTANLDNRSLRINFEMTLVFESDDINKTIESMLLEDFKHCLPLTQQDLDKQSLFTRFLSRLARLFAPIQ
jgi:cardiolipin synthase